MQFHFFRIPAIDPDRAQRELNAMIARHRVAQLDWEWVADAENSFWAVRVAIASGPGPIDDAIKAAPERGTKSASRVDYREVLPPEDFEKFAALRRWRKVVAERSNVQLFNVFTNEHLATIVTKPVRTLADLESLDGVGPSRVQRFGEDLIRALDAIHSGSEAIHASGADAASG